MPRSDFKNLRMPRSDVVRDPDPITAGGRSRTIIPRSSKKATRGARQQATGKRTSSIVQIHLYSTYVEYKRTDTQRARESARQKTVLSLVSFLTLNSAVRISLRKGIEMY
jgi:hypothetical protein